MRQYFQLVVIVIVALLHIPPVYAATEIHGTVTAKRGDSVQVTFEPHETAGPAVGDAVSFSKEIPGTGGIKAKAGEGTVTEVDGSTVWVKTSDDRPNLKMDAVIQATGNPAPKEYSFELSGSEFEFRGVVYWHPNGIFRFNSSAPLIVTGYYADPIRFPDGGYFSTPEYWSVLEKTHKAYHLESLKRRIELNKYESDISQEFSESVWSGREVKGKNTVFYVSQVIDTKRFHDKSGSVRKIISEEKNQEFLISFELPKPPSDSRTLVKAVWELSFRIPDYADKQYRPEYWEKICLEVLQSASVELRGGRLDEDRMKKKPIVK